MINVNTSDGVINVNTSDGLRSTMTRTRCDAALLLAAPRGGGAGGRGALLPPQGWSGSAGERHAKNNQNTEQNKTATKRNHYLLNSPCV